MAFSGHFKKWLFATPLCIAPLALAQKPVTVALLPPADTHRYPNTMQVDTSPARQEKPIDLTPFAPANPHQPKKSHPPFQAADNTALDISPAHEDAPLDLTHFAPQDPDLRMDLADQNWNIFAGFGYMSALSATRNSVFQVTADPYGERDQLSDPKQSTHLQYLIGFQHVFYRHNAVFQRIDFGPSLFFDPVTFSGQVYQYQDTTLNNYDYRYKVTPVNLEIEAQFLLRRHGLPHHIGVAPYFLVGAGASFINLSYSETALGDTPPNTAYSFSGSETRPLLVAGLGLQWDILFKFFIRTDYRYLYRGDVALKNNVFLNPVNANLDTQSFNVLFGYRFA
jgi:opacity protein-like surface antigen